MLKVFHHQTALALFTICVFEIIMTTAVNLESKSLVLTLTVRKNIVLISTDKWCKFNVYLMWSQLIIQTEV